MSNYTSFSTSPSAFTKLKKQGITEKKKAELDALIIQVTDAQHEVEQFQAIVTSLTTKAANFQGFLAVAESNKTQAYNNKILANQLLQSTLDLQSTSENTFSQAETADSKTQDLAAGIKMVMDKLIYSAEVVNKLANLIVRQKALNPLISDDLVSMVSTAGKDANNAVSLTLIALKATFAASASNMEAEAALALEYTQAIKLHQTFTGTQPGSSDPKQRSKSLNGQLQHAYTKANNYYNQTVKAVKITNKQLNAAKVTLAVAQVNLKSLQAGLAAANAAALAS